MQCVDALTAATNLPFMLLEQQFPISHPFYFDKITFSSRFDTEIENGTETMLCARLHMGSCFMSWEQMLGVCLLSLLYLHKGRVGVLSGCQGCLLSRGDAGELRWWGQCDGYVKRGWIRVIGMGGVLACSATGVHFITQWQRLGHQQVVEQVVTSGGTLTQEFWAHPLRCCLWPSCPVSITPGLENAPLNSAWDEWTWFCFAAHCFLFALFFFCTRKDGRAIFFFFFMCQNLSNVKKKFKVSRKNSANARCAYFLFSRTL